MYLSRVLSVLTLCALSTQAYSSSYEEITSSLENDARTFRTNTYEIVSAENSGANQITTLRRDLNDPKSTFAVIKRGERAPVETFIYKFSHDMGLGDVVVPCVLTTMPDHSEAVSIEEFVKFIPSPMKSDDISPEMTEFAQKFQASNGSLCLQRFGVELGKLEDTEKNRWKKFLNDHIDPENTQKLFLFYSLTHHPDFTGRNTMVTLTSKNKLWFKMMDSVGSFAESTDHNTFSVVMPGSSAPLSENLLQLLKSWPNKLLQQKQAFLDATRSQVKFDFMVERVSALAQFLGSYPHQSLRNAHVLAYLPLHKRLAGENADYLSDSALGLFRSQEHNEYAIRMRSLGQYGWRDLATIALTCGRDGGFFDYDRPIGATIVVTQYSSITDVFKAIETLPHYRAFMESQEKVINVDLYQFFGIPRPQNN